MSDAPNTSRVEDLLRQMTLDEKIAMVHGDHDPQPLGEAGYLAGVPRLGIPPLRLTDGPAGIRVTEPTTAMPAPVALAASFSPELARRYGEVLGRDGRAHGQHVLLSPMVNIVRVPQGGRNFETFGEDPLLAGRMVAEEIRGIEGAGLIATVKPFAANNFENDRLTVSAEVDERTLNEIYLPAFEDAIEAGVGSVMASYNRVNGTYASESRMLLTDILRDRWGFRGFVMSDWGATHSTAPAIKAGLDMDMPGMPWGPNDPAYFFEPMKEAVLSGEVPEAMLDEAVRRTLVQMERFGLLDGEGAAAIPSPDPEGDSRVVREVAAAGAVLLRNEGEALPLRKEETRSLAVIGPTARQPLIGGGGSARVTPAHAESPLDALVRHAGPDLDIRFTVGIDLDGVPIPAIALSSPGEDGSPQPGLRRERVRRPAPHTEGETVVDDGWAAVTEPLIDFTGSRGLPADGLEQGMAWRWSGTISAPETGDYALKIQGKYGHVSLHLDGREVAMTGWGGSLIHTTDGLENATAHVRLEAGEPHEITVWAGGGWHGGPSSEPLQVRLAWVTPGMRAERVAEAVEAAESAETVLLFAYDESTEGVDRASLHLPEEQDTLIEAVSLANPRTIVVLNTGCSVLMPWLEKTAAVLEMWYPGQDGADATAALLFGEENPAGRLPVTFPRDAERMPTADPERYPGVDGKAVYSEGIFVGYRWYDAEAVEPLFPFGHGLSYTRFEYSDLRVTPSEDGSLDVSFQVRNTGPRNGEEVAQVYVGPPADAPVPMVDKALGGFRRVSLAPGEAERITVTVPPRPQSYWSTERHGWVRPEGERPVYVGSSSRDVRLRN